MRDLLNKERRAHQSQLPKLKSEINNLTEFNRGWTQMDADQGWDELVQQVVTAHSEDGDGGRILLRPAHNTFFGGVLVSPEMKRRMRSADELNNQVTKERRRDGNIEPPPLKSELKKLTEFNRGWTRMKTGGACSTGG